MFSALHRKLGTVSTGGNGPAARRPRRSRPALESLEGRQLLSTLGGETQVNPVTADKTYSSTTASSSNGSSVAVWVDDYYNTGDTDIWAQRYDATGAKVGSAIQVDYTTAKSSNPNVAMDSQGDFVVTWVNRTNASDLHGEVMARYFTAGGIAATDRFAVYYQSTTPLPPDTTTDHPVVAMNNNSFVVAFEYWGQGPDGLQSDVLADRYTVTPGPSGPVIHPLSYSQDNVRIDVAVEADQNFTHPSIAMSPSGYFDIAYQHQSVWGGANDVQDNRYFFTGAFESHFQVTPSGENAQHPAIARDNLGNAVVVYERQEGTWGTGIWATRISSADTLYSSQIYLEDQTGHEHNPSVAMEPSGGVGGGRFVVAFDTLDANGGSAVEAMEFSSQSSGNGRIAVFGSPYSPIAGFSPNISMDASGHFNLTYSRQTGPAKTDVFLRRGTL
jgi:hypothetical protein